MLSWRTLIHVQDPIMSQLLSILKQKHWIRRLRVEILQGSFPLSIKELFLSIMVNGELRYM